MTKHILPALALAALLASCEKSEPSVPETTYIGFSLEEMTKGALINSKDNYVAQADNSLTVTAYQGSDEVIPVSKASYSSTGEKWETVVRYPWPTDADNVMKSMEFFSWTPEAEGQGTVSFTKEASSSASFTYTAQTDSTRQKDILFGYYSGVSSTGVAPLSFGHALAAVKFRVALGCTVDDVCISGLSDGGTCTVAFASPLAFTWDLKGMPKTNSYHPTDNDASAGYGTLSAGDQIGKGAVMLVPQAMTSTAKVTLTYTPAGGSQETAEFSLEGKTALKAGFITTYTLNMNSLTCDVTVTHWDTEDQGSLKVVTDTYDYKEGEFNYGPGIKIGNVIWAPVNCGIGGMIEGETEGQYPYGKLYQWGRKYGQAYELGEIEPSEMTFEEGQSLAKKDAFGYFEYEVNECSYEYNWYSGPFTENLWNLGTESKPIKSTYDPCPDGWRVPSFEELHSLLGGGSTRADSFVTYNGQSGHWFCGMNEDMDVLNSDNEYEGVFLPAAGYRKSSGSVVWWEGNGDDDPDDPTVYTRGKYGYYWSSSVWYYISVDDEMICDPAYGFYMYFLEGQASTDMGQRNGGCSVRCVYCGY